MAMPSCHLGGTPSRYALQFDGIDRLRRLASLSDDYFRPGRE